MTNQTRNELAQDSGLREVFFTNADVYKILSRGGTLAEYIVELDRQLQAMTGQLVLLQCICPQKRVIDGVLKIWHCPDHLVPDPISF